MCYGEIPCDRVTWTILYRYRSTIISRVYNIVDSFMFCNSDEMCEQKFGKCSEYWDEFWCWACDIYIFSVVVERTMLNILYLVYTLQVVECSTMLVHGLDVNKWRNEIDFSWFLFTYCKHKRFFHIHMEHNNTTHLLHRHTPSISIHVDILRISHNLYKKKKIWPDQFWTHVRWRYESNVSSGQYYTYTI